MLWKVTYSPGRRPGLISVETVIQQFSPRVMVPVRESPIENPRVKMFVIDPKKFKTEGITALNTSGTLTRTAAIPSPPNVTPPLPISTVRDGPCPPPPPVSPPTRGILPISKENWKDEHEELEQQQDNLMSRLLKKTFRTRAGRVTKPRGTGPGAATPTVVLPEGSKVRRRPPPEYFRCQTCQKFYLGNTKLKDHLKKFPTHLGSLEYQKTVAPTRRVSHSVAIQFEGSDNNTLPPRVKQEPRLSSVSMSPAPPTAIVPSLEPFPVDIKIASVLPPPAFATMAVDVSHPNSPVSVPRNVRSFNEVQSERLTESPSSNSSQFWSAFRSFSNTSRDTSSPEDGTGPGSVGGGVRKEEIGDLNAHKTVWDLVEKKLVQSGINQILTELSDVAEKLGKIARDKIIPIREDEEERISTSTPIVRVENPFMSLLLDLPFGTYVFREDGGIRRPPLPPPSTDLSLTAGEVDIDKFLACNMEMDLSLPHLTSLDIAAVCNN